MSLKKSTFLLLVIILALFAGCSKQSGDDVYLVDYKVVKSYSADYIKLAIDVYSSLYPDITDISSNTSYDVKVYTIKYKTTFEGKSVTASGIVGVPDQKGKFPVISFQNGTNSCHSNAPSANPGSTLYSILTMMAGNGYIISFPDYIGFGSTEEYLHPYYYSEASNQAIEDMIMAVNELVNNHLKADNNNKLFLMGYSQGGWATMTALKDIETNNPLDMDLVAASCGAGAYKLIAFSEEVLAMDNYSNPFYFPYFIEGRIENGLMSDPLSLFFQEPYASTIPSLFNGDLCNGDINLQLTDVISDLFTADLIQNFSDGAQFAALRQELLGASVEPWHTTIPLMMVHSDGDESVPYNQSVNFISDLVDAGTSEQDITFIPLTGLLHNDAVLPWGIATINWFNQLNSSK